MSTVVHKQRNYFVSYSNKEYAFAESLVDTLKAAAPDIDLWFAPQALDEGHDWFQEITNALHAADCEGLILVASHAALTSIWVAYEWKTMLDRGKPIYIVLFEPVHTTAHTLNMAYSPADVESDTQPFYRIIKCLEPTFSLLPMVDADENRSLSINLTLPTDALFHQAVAVVDCRQQFKRNLERLIECLHGQAVVQDVVPTPNRLGIPLKLPYDLWLIVLSLLLPGVFCMLFGGLSTTDSLILRDDGGVIAAFLVVVIGFGMFHRAWQFIKRESTTLEAIPHLHLNHYLMPSVIMLPVMGILAYRAAARPSEDVYRWLPRDAVLPFQRKRKQKVALTLDALQANFPEPKYQMVYAAPDRRIGHRIRKALAKLGYVDVPESADDCAFYVIILSNKTNIADVQRLNASGKPVLAVVASSITLPSHMDEIFRHQWIDYRTHPSNLLAFIAQAAPSVPISPDTLRVPSFTCLFQAMLFNGTVLAAAAIAILFYPSLVEEISPDCVWCEIVLPLLAGIIYLTLVSRILQRRVSTEIFTILIVIAWLFGFLLIFSLGYVMGEGDEISGPLPIALTLYYAFLFPLIVLYYARRLFRWLPAFSRIRQRGQTLAVPYGGQIWRVSLVFVLMATLIFLCRVANAS